MGKESTLNKLKCIKCKSPVVECIGDFFSSKSDPQYDRVLETVMCEKCGWTGVAIYRLELVYSGDENV